MDRPLPDTNKKSLPTMPQSWLRCLLVAIGAIAVLVDSDGLQALQRAAGYTVGNQNVFAEVFQYLTGLRDGLAPLAIPVAGIGLAGAGFAYMAGSPLAQRVGMGVVLGTALVLLGPTIVQ